MYIVCIISVYLGLRTFEHTIEFIERVYIVDGHVYIYQDDKNILYLENIYLHI